jgi:hypothetical protein
MNASDINSEKGERRITLNKAELVRQAEADCHEVFPEHKKTVLWKKECKNCLQHP